MGAYPDVLDWLQFRVDNAYGLMRWRIETIREIDAVHRITAHGIAASLTRMASGGADDRRAAAAEVQSYGYAWGSSRHGDEPWKQFHAVDLVRAGARGRPFWHAEAYGGPLLMAPNVLGKPRDEGRIAAPQDIRYWNMVSFMAGATGLLYLRWRPLLDGPLFGAFGPYGMDGSRTPRPDMSASVARWAAAPEQRSLWESRPVKGGIGIVYVPETQMFAYAQQGSSDHYARSMQGAYQGFFDNNIQADWVHIEHIEEHDALYLPFPTMLSQETADRLCAWVESGGTLVSEGCPGYFGPGGRVGTVRPNLSLDELFGARESYVEFTPDLLGDLEVNVGGRSAWGGLSMQAYEPTTGTAVGWYEDGRVAAVDNVFGAGRTRLVGGMLGAGYGAHPDGRSPTFFADALNSAGAVPFCRTDDPVVTTRLHAGAGGTYLWAANPRRRPSMVRILLSGSYGPCRFVKALWGPAASIRGPQIGLEIGARDVAVVELSCGSSS